MIILRYYKDATFLRGVKLRDGCADMCNIVNIIFLKCQCLSKFEKKLL
jgi:hypothetical protein